MGKALRVVTDVLMGFSITAWVSGPMMEKFAIEPAIAAAKDKEQAGAILGAAYKAYSNVVHIGMAGMLITNIIKMLGDDLRKKDKGTAGYRRLATLGDIQLFTALGLGGMTRMISKRVKRLDPSSAEAAQGKANLNRIANASIILSVTLLITSALQYKTRQEIGNKK